VKVVRHQNVRVYSVPQAGAQKPYAIYYDLATGAFRKEGPSIFDVCGDEIRESFIRVTPKIWHTVTSEHLSGRVRKPDLHCGCYHAQVGVGQVSQPALVRKLIDCAKVLFYAIPGELS